MLLLEKSLDPILPTTGIVSFTFRSATILFLCSVLANLFIVSLLLLFIPHKQATAFKIQLYSTAGG